jgi:hypothetical protein
MFVQFIQGQTAEPSELKAALDRWVAEVSPGATGWLSSTSGVTADGIAVSVVCFESEEAARRNSERPEQHQWYMETAKLFAGEVTFLDCSQVMTYGQAPPPTAGFVQIIQGRVTDIDRLTEVSEKSEPYLRAERPDLLGWLAGFDPASSRAVQAAYFRDEESAREGERRELSAEMKALSEEEMSLLQDATYLDLRDPWIHTR